MVSNWPTVASDTCSCLRPLSTEYLSEKDFFRAKSFGGGHIVYPETTICGEGTSFNAPTLLIDYIFRIFYRMN